MLRALRRPIRWLRTDGPGGRRVWALAGAALASAVQAAPSTTGQTGLINMPDARIERDGTFRLGLSNADPYLALWSSLTFFPWLEASGRYTRVSGVPGFGEGTPETATFGDFKDKSFDGKLRLWDEGVRLPALSLGAQDLQGTNVFAAQYLAMSKRFGDLDVTLGYGRERIDGLFGGVRYSPAFLPSWSFVAEYDANDYTKDIGSDLSGAAGRKKGINLAAEYRWGWLGLQASYQHETLGLNAYVSVPTDLKEFVPKTDEPPPYLKMAPRPSERQWKSDPTYAGRLKRALEEQNFRNVRIGYANGKLSLALASGRISNMSRAVGRAARTALAFAPIEAREIEITYTARELPLATYGFFDLPLLQRYFNGMATRAQLAERVAIRYASPAAASMPMAGAGEAPSAGSSETDGLDGLDQVRDEPLVRIFREGDFVRLARADPEGNRFQIRPLLSGYFNDPSGAFKYELSLVASLDRNLGNRWFFAVGLQAVLSETVSDVTQPSNSTLPHVRSDIALYRRDSKVRLTRLLVNKFFHPAERVYARASAGWYEEMFAGGGGQALYLWPSAQWAADVAVDWLRQRDTQGWFGFRDYSTVTAIGSLHRRLPMGVTGTVRAGRFLAKDEGARFELSRRFRSGMRFGGWYTYTNGNDITSPGSPSNPYHDKGIFLSVPLNIMLTRDTQATAGFALSPWTRDVGQMVASPADLYALVEKPLLTDAQYHDGLSQLADVPDDYPLPDLGSSVLERSWLRIAEQDAAGAGELIDSKRTWKVIGLGALATVLSGGLDDPGWRFAQEYGDNSVVRALRNVGNAIPWVGLGAAGIAALDSADRRASNTGIAALQAGAVGLLGDLALEYALGRSRPTEGKGTTDFHPFESGNSDSSFPSTHATLAWSLLTPFASEYELPWIYGAAALTNFARISDGSHWFSDTVGGGLLGFGLAKVFWEWRRAPDETVRVGVGPGGIRASVPLR
jgi:membrane-associated phospholipid phosphatase